MTDFQGVIALKQQAAFFLTRRFCVRGYVVSEKKEKRGTRRKKWQLVTGIL
jgi:hypothetical protein